LFLHFDLFVESARKIDIWHFMKKNISDSRTAENNWGKRFQKWVLFNQNRLNERTANVVIDSSSPFQTQLRGIHNDNDISARIDPKL